MATPNLCLPQVQACAMRVCDLDSNGVPHPGATSIYVTDSFTEVSFDPTIEAGATIKLDNACGGTAIDFESEPRLTKGVMKFKIIQQASRLAAKLGGGSVIVDDTNANAKGLALPRIGKITGNGVSIEVWTKRILNGSLDPDFPYAWWVFPKVINLRGLSRVFGNSAQEPEFEGLTVENTNWFDGPLNDWNGPSDSIAQWLPTKSLPTIACGPTALVAS